jgi:hypothetical protein
MQVKPAEGRQPDIIALERLLDRPDLPAATRKRIEAEIRNIRSGEKGEHDAAYEIEFWFGRSPNWASIHDLRIEVGGLTAQMDHLLINRLAEIWVLESKSFAEGVSVNDHGEWMRWWNGRPEGMPSPIEQNRRHVHLLGRAFDDGLVKAPRRLGLVPMKPRIRSLVLVSNGARIGRPKRKVEGLDQVLKAEQLKTRLLDEFDGAPAPRLAGVIGKEGLEAFARGVAALHRPSTTDWEARFGLTTTAPAESAIPRPSPRDDLAGARERQRTGGGTCARCGREISATVVRYCAEHADEFGGAVYCMACQPVVRARAERPMTIPDWREVLDRYRTPTRLRTVAREAPVIVVRSGDDLTITPGSTVQSRRLTRADFERAAPLLGGAGRGEVNEASRNSSYVEAILADVRRGRER